MLDKKLFVENFAGLCEVYEREATETLTATYYEALKDMSNNEFKRAIHGVMGQSRFHKLPLPGEIREFVYGKLSDRSTLALQKVERALREVGAYNSIVFDDPVIHKVVSSFDNGWIGIADMTTEEWVWGRKDFIQLYEAMSTQGIQSAPHRLMGRIETDNENKGQKGKFQIVYFGGKQAAIEWQKKIMAEIAYGEMKMSDFMKSIGHDEL